MRTVLLFFFGAALFFAPLDVALAGFGITPPYVNNSRLTRGSGYDQKITLVRSDADVDLEVNITMNIPGIEGWFSIDRGEKFVMPKGTTQMPIVVHVAVPPEAEYKEYKGAIRIRTAPLNTGEGGGVSIALGAQVDVDIKVVDKIYDFEVRRIRMSDLEEGRRKWGLFFPGKIRFFVTVENTGNTDFGPTMVKFDIYDSEMETLLESIQNTNKLEQIAPFATKEVLAELPTKLPAGRYMAKYTVYKNDEIAQQNQVNVSIMTMGAVAGYSGYGLDGLSMSDKIKVAGILGVPLALLLILIIILVIKRRKLKRIRRAHGVSGY